MTGPRFFITDVFTNRRYGGNQLATFIDCESLSDHEMQEIAREIHFSETTFITSRIPENGGYNVRIFTPASEVKFAGHPTLGTAHVIRNRLHLTEANEIALNLPVGQIPVTFTKGAAGESLLWMKQVAPTFGKSLDASAMAHVLGLEPSAIDTDLPIEEVSTGFPTFIVPLKSLHALKKAKINRDAYFALVNDTWAKLVLVFSREGCEAAQSLSMRVFADFYGIIEDAATGSAAGSLSAYLSRHGVFGGPNLDLLAGQGYEMGRPSTLALRAKTNDNGTIEVEIGGGVVDVAEGVWG